MGQRIQPARSAVTPLAAGALGRLAVVGGALLVLWAAIGGVLGWWG
jgi:hypothetical protein